jgi:hypothetical protein
MRGRGNELVCPWVFVDVKTLVTEYTYQWHPEASGGGEYDADSACGRMIVMPVDEPVTFKRGWVPIWVHVTIALVAVITGFIGALVLGVVVLHRLGLSGQSLAGFGIFAGLSFAAVIIPMVVMYKLVPARCARCGGRCWAPNPRGNDTVKYTCEHCGRVVDTHMRGGAG